MVSYQEKGIICSIFQSYSTKEHLSPWLLLVYKHFERERERKKANKKWSEGRTGEWSILKIKGSILRINWCSVNGIMLKDQGEVTWRKYFQQNKI